MFLILFNFNEILIDFFFSYQTPLKVAMMNNQIDIAELLRSVGGKC